MESSEPVTTDTVMGIVGMKGDVVTKSNAAEIADRLRHPFLKELGEGDVLWPVKDTAKRRIHVCAVRMARSKDEKPTGLIAREMGVHHRGTVSIVDGAVVLTSDGKHFDMLTCLPWRPALRSS